MTRTEQLRELVYASYEKHLDNDEVRRMYYASGAQNLNWHAPLIVSRRHVCRNRMAFETEASK